MIKKQFKNTLTKKDFFLYLLNRNTFILTTPLMIVALIIAFIYVVRLDGFQFTDMIFILPVLIFLLVYIRIYISVTKAPVNYDVEITITDKVYTEVSKDGTVTQDLNKFHSYFENDKYFYLFVDKMNALVLPKREFDEEEIKKIQTYFSSSLKRTTYLNLRNIVNLLFFVGVIVCIVVLLIELS